MSTLAVPGRPSTPRRAALPWGVPLALVAALAALAACRAREGDRCVCAEDCREGLVCVASGRVLADGECSPAVGDDATPGVCLPADEAAEDDGAGGQVEPFMDLGSKLDFEPGPPPDEGSGDATGTTEGTGSSGGTTDATGSTGTTDATGSTGTGSTTDASSSSSGSSSGSSTDASGSSSGSTGST